TVVTLVEFAAPVGSHGQFAQNRRNRYFSHKVGTIFSSGVQSHKTRAGECTFPVYNGSHLSRALRAAPIDGGAIGSMTWKGAVRILWLGTAIAGCAHASSPCD